MTDVAVDNSHAYWVNDYRYGDCCVYKKSLSDGATVRLAPNEGDGWPYDSYPLWGGEIAVDAPHLYVPLQGAGECGFAEVSLDDGSVRYTALDDQVLGCPRAIALDQDHVYFTTVLGIVRAVR
jgi:hypothetical protein